MSQNHDINDREIGSYISEPASLAINNSNFIFDNDISLEVLAQKMEMFSQKVKQHGSLADLVGFSQNQEHRELTSEQIALNSMTDIEVLMYENWSASNPEKFIRTHPLSAQKLPTNPSKLRRYERMIKGLSEIYGMRQEEINKEHVCYFTTNYAEDIPLLCAVTKALEAEECEKTNIQKDVELELQALTKIISEYSMVSQLLFAKINDYKKNCHAYHQTLVNKKQQLKFSLRN